MDKKKLLLTAQSLLCAALALWLAAAALGVCREGLARKAADPLAPIYSPELVTQRLKEALPLFVLTVAVTAAGAVLRVKDENGLKGVKGGKVEHKPFPKEKTLRAALLLAGVLLVVLGVLNGSARDVLGKAVKTCTECVGLG